MITKKAVLDGKEIDVVVQIDDNDVEVFMEQEDLEDTINLTEVIETVQNSELGDNNE